MFAPRKSIYHNTIVLFLNLTLYNISKQTKKGQNHINVNILTPNFAKFWSDNTKQHEGISLLAEIGYFEFFPIKLTLPE